MRVKIRLRHGNVYFSASSREPLSQKPSLTVKHILLATDLRDTAANVAAFALAIAESFDARLTVYHAFGQPSLALGDTTLEERRAEILRKQKAMIERMQSSSTDGPEVSYLTSVDYAADGILNAADSGAYDLVVLGMHEDRDGRGQFSELAYTVLKKCETAVLAVPSEATFNGVQEIVFATDLEREDEDPLEQLQAWRRNLNAELFVVHFVEDRAKLGEARSKLGVWRDFYASRPNIHFEIAEGDLDDDIGRYVAQRGGDMLVLETHDRGFFASVFGQNETVEIARSIQVPLLVLHGRV